MPSYYYPYMTPILYQSCSRVLRAPTPLRVGTLYSEKRPGVVEDQPVLIDVGAVVGAGGNIADADIQVLQRAALHGVADIQIPLPLLALETHTGIDVITPDITHRGHQPRHTQRSEVVVVAYLPGALVGPGKFVGRYLVTQRRDVVEYPREGIITEHRLIAEVEGMATMAGRQQAVERLVVDIAEQAVTVLCGIVETDIGAQHPVTHRLAVFEVVVTLVVDIFQLRVPHGNRGALVVEGVFGRGIVEAIGRGIAGQLRQMAELGAHLVVTGLVQQAARAELARLQGQAGDFPGDDTGALIGRRQQADITEGKHRQVRRLLADLQLGFGDLELQRRTQTTEGVRRLAIAVSG